LASLVNELLLGYVLVQSTSEFNQLWPNRQAFLGSLTTLLTLAGDPPAVNLASIGLNASPGQDLLVQDAQDAVQDAVQDIPAAVVQQILRQASKSHLQDYALAYSFFGAGLTATEVLGLQRHQHISSPQQHTLIVVSGGRQRQVPLNQWIAGHRYGSYTQNPLIKWLRSRKDTCPAMFVNEEGQPLDLTELQQRWQGWTAGLANPLGNTQPLQLQQTRQTWCIEMLMRGMSLENLSLLTGLAPAQLQPYAQRAREKAALEQATQLDRKAGPSG
jgi:site-specific recombinase XerD